jgi:hypothetical protein
MNPPKMTDDFLDHHEEQPDECEDNDLANFLSKSLENIQRKTTDENSFDQLEKELQIFELGGEKGILLKKAFTSMNNIAPSSIESERAFSIAAYFCSKIRNRLSNDMLSVCVALKFYFNSINDN